MGDEALTQAQIGSSAPWLQYLSSDKHRQLSDQLDIAIGKVTKALAEKGLSKSDIAHEKNKRSRLLEEKYRLELINPDARFPKFQEAIIHPCPKRRKAQQSILGGREMSLKTMKLSRSGPRLTWPITQGIFIWPSTTRRDPVHGIQHRHCLVTCFLMLPAPEK